MFRCAGGKISFAILATAALATLRCGPALIASFVLGHLSHLDPRVRVTVLAN